MVDEEVSELCCKCNIAELLVHVKFTFYLFMQVMICT